MTDFSVEFDQALMYKDMAPEIEQVYLMSDLRFVFVRATRIREVARLGHDVSHLVPEPSPRSSGDLAAEVVAKETVLTAR